MTKQTIAAELEPVIGRKPFSLLKESIFGLTNYQLFELIRGVLAEKSPIKADGAIAIIAAPWLSKNTTNEEDEKEEGEQAEEKENAETIYKKIKQTLEQAHQHFAISLADQNAEIGDTLNVFKILTDYLIDSFKDSDAQMIKDIMSMLSQYLIEVDSLRSPESKILALQALPTDGFYLQCLPGTSSRISDLLRQLQTPPEKAPILDAHNTAIGGLIYKLKNRITSEEEIHVTACLEESLGLIKSEDAKTKDQFYRVPRRDIPLVFMQQACLSYPIQLKEGLWQRIDEQMDELLKIWQESKELLSQLAELRAEMEKFSDADDLNDNLEAAEKGKQIMALDRQLLPWKERLEALGISEIMILAKVETEEELSQLLPSAQFLGTKFPKTEEERKDFQTEVILEDLPLFNADAQSLIFLALVSGEKEKVSEAMSILGLLSKGFAGGSNFQVRGVIDLLVQHFKSLNENWYSCLPNDRLLIKATIQRLIAEIIVPTLGESAKDYSEIAKQLEQAALNPIIVKILGVEEAGLVSLSELLQIGIPFEGLETHFEIHKQCPQCLAAQVQQLTNDEINTLMARPDWLKILDQMRQRNIVELDTLLKALSVTVNNLDSDSFELMRSSFFCENEIWQSNKVMQWSFCIFQDALEDGDLRPIGLLRENELLDPYLKVRRNESTITLLGYSVLQNNYRLAETLLQYPFNQNKQNVGICLKPPLLTAVEKGFNEIATLLLEKGINPNDPFNGIYPIHEAAKTGNEELVEVLLNHGARPFAIEDDDHEMLEPSPLGFAAKGGYPKIVELLLEKMTPDQINAKTVGEDGKTALELAILGNQKSVIEMMLSKPEVAVGEDNLKLAAGINGENSAAILEMLQAALAKKKGHQKRGRGEDDDENPIAEIQLTKKQKLTERRLEEGQSPGRG